MGWNILIIAGLQYDHSRLMGWILAILYRIDLINLDELRD